MKNKSELPYTVLVAEDDADDRMLIRDAWEETGTPSQLYFVKDGEEMMDYLYQRGLYATENSAPRPYLILLDLNMPRKNGFEVLKEVKKKKEFRRIPIVVLTTSTAEEDINRSYMLGVNSYIPKPSRFEGWMEVMKTIGSYWFNTVQLPPQLTGG